MTALPTIALPKAGPTTRRRLPPDPRQFKMIRAGDLMIDQRVQRETRPESVAVIINEFSWFRFEALTVVQIKPGVYLVVEGGHRATAVQQMDPDCKVPCMVLPDDPGEKAQAELGYQITKGRRQDTAYEIWRRCYSSGHPHEIAATAVLDQFNLRVGAAPSAASIGAVATLKRIVHGGGFTPEYGADLLAATLQVITAAFPTHDHQSSVTRWNAHILRAVADLIHRHPDLDRNRLARSLTVRPAVQWVHLGKGAEGQTPHVVIEVALVYEYNRNRKRGRISVN